MGISRGTGIPKIPAKRETPETREIPESQEFPGREKFEAIREGGNGNFLLNIAGPVSTRCNTLQIAQLSEAYWT